MVNADLSRRAVANTHQLAWEDIAPGVSCKLLERFRAQGVVYSTQIIRLAGQGQLVGVASDGCEDLVVLDGELSDGHDVFPEGTYIHSPPRRPHTWTTPSHCTFLLKHRRTGDHDRYRAVVDINAPSWRSGMRRGMFMMSLRELTCSRVVLLQFAPGAQLDDHEHIDGEEFFVLRGALVDEAGSYPEGTWVRQPPGSSHTVSAPAGATLWTVSGHLTPELVASVA